MKKQLKRGLSMLLMVVMLMSLLPAEVIAASVEELTTTEESSPSPTEVVPNDEGEPSDEPSEEQTEEPTAEPSEEPSAEPTEAPTEEPSSAQEESAEPTTDVTEGGSNDPAEDRAPGEGAEEGEKPGDEMNPMIVESSSKFAINEDGTVSYSADLTQVPPGTNVWIAVVATNTYTVTSVRPDTYNFRNYDTTRPKVIGKEAGNFPIWYGEGTINGTSGTMNMQITEADIQLEMVAGKLYPDLDAAKANNHASATYVGDLEYCVFIVTDAGNTGVSDEHKNFYRLAANFAAAGPKLTADPVKHELTSADAKEGGVIYSDLSSVGEKNAIITAIEIEARDAAGNVIAGGATAFSNYPGNMGGGANRKTCITVGDTVAVGATNARLRIQWNSLDGMPYTDYTYVAKVSYEEASSPLEVEIVFSDKSIVFEELNLYVEAGSQKEYQLEPACKVGADNFKGTTRNPTTVALKEQPSGANIVVGSNTTTGANAFTFSVDATQQLTAVSTPLVYKYEVTQKDNRDNVLFENEPLTVNVYVIAPAQLEITPNPIEISGNDSYGTSGTTYRKSFEVVNNGLGDAVILDVVFAGLTSTNSSYAVDNTAWIKSQLVDQRIPKGGKISALYYQISDADDTYAGTDGITIIYDTVSDLPQANEGEFMRNPVTAPVNIRLARPILQADPINTVLKAANSFTASQTVMVKNAGGVKALQSDAGYNDEDGKDALGVTRYRHIEILQKMDGGGYTSKWASGNEENAHNQPNDIATAAQVKFTTKTGKEILISTSDLYGPIVSGVSAGSSYNFTFTATGPNTISASDAEGGVLAEGILRIGYGEEDGSVEYTFDIPITIKFEAPATTSATVEVRKGGTPDWNTAGGFVAPSEVALSDSATVAPKAGEPLTKDSSDASNKFTATITNLSLNTNYYVWVNRDGSWEQVGTYNSGSAAGTCVVDYYSATVEVAKAGTNQTGRVSIGTASQTAVGTNDSASILVSAVSKDGGVKTFTGGRNTIHYMVAENTGYTISNKDNPTVNVRNGITAPTLNGGTWTNKSFTIPDSDVEITYAVTWSVKIKTVDKDGNDITASQEVVLKEGSNSKNPDSGSTGGVYTFSGLETGKTYTVAVNGFTSNVTVTQANAGDTPVNVTLYTVTTGPQYVGKTDGTELTGYSLPDGNAPTVYTGIKNGADAGSATVAYVPQGGTGSLKLTASTNSNPRLALYATNQNEWTQTVTSTNGVSATYNIGTALTNNVIIKAKFVPSWKVTLAVPRNSAVGTSVTGATATLNGTANQAFNGSNAVYVQISTSTTTSGTLSITNRSADPATHIFKEWQTSTDNASYSTATLESNALTVASDIYLAPYYLTKPTLSSINTTTYDIGPGAAGGTNPSYDRDWTKRDADDVATIQYKANLSSGTPNTWTALTKGTDYTFDETSAGSGVYRLVFKDEFLKKFNVDKTGTLYDLKFVSTTNAAGTDLPASFKVKSTPLVLQKVDIKEGSATPAAHVAVDGTVTYDAHQPATIDKDNKLTWEWYYTPSAVTQTNTTTALTSVTLPTSSTKLTTAAAISADGRTLDLSKLSTAEQTAVQGNNIFAVVTASVTGEGKVITNGIPVDYKGDVTVKVQTGTTTSTNNAITSKTGYKVELRPTTANVDTRTAIELTEFSSGKFSLPTDTYLYGGVSYNVYVNAVEGDTTSALVSGQTTTIAGTAKSATVQYYQVTLAPITVSNTTKYSTANFTNGGAFFANSDKFAITSATVGSSVAKAGNAANNVQFAALTGQNIALSFNAWTKDYTMAYSGAGTTTGGNDPTTAATTSISNLSAATTVGGTLTLNLYDVQAYVQGSGALDEITMKLTDDSKDYIFTTKTGTGKILGTKSGSSVTSIAASGSATFSLPKGSYTATGVVNNATTLKGYRVPHNATTTAALTSTGATETIAVNGAADYDISVVQTGLTLTVADSYSPANSSTSVTNSGTANASYTPGNSTKVTNGSFTREVHLPYMFDSAVTIPLTLTNSASTDKITGISIAQTNPTGTPPTVSIEALADTEKTLAIDASVTKNITIAADATGTVQPGTYNVVFKVSYDTPETNDPTVTYTLKIIVEQVEITGVTAANGATAAPTNAKVGETLSYSAYTADAYTSGISASTQVFDTPYTIDTMNNLPLRAGTDFTYQWYRSTNNTWESTDTKISGATNATYTVAAADAGNYLFLQITAASGKRAFGNAVAGPFTVGYDANITVRVDGTAIANNTAGYTVALRPDSATDASTDIPLTFKSSGVFTTQTGSGSNWANSGVLTRGTTYRVVVKNGTYSGASAVVLPNTFDISFGTTARTVDYYTVNFETAIASNRISHYYTGTGETFATNPAITAKVTSTTDNNKAVAAANTVLAGVQVTFSTDWTQDYTAKWFENGTTPTDKTASATGNTATTNAAGNNTSSLALDYNSTNAGSDNKINTIYATLTQKTYTVTGVVANPTDEVGGYITEATLNNGSLTYTTSATGSGKINPNNNDSLGNGTGTDTTDTQKGAVGATVTFVLPKGDYTLGSTIGNKTTFMGYSDETKTDPVADFTGFAVAAGQANTKASFKIYVLGENAILATNENKGTPTSTDSGKFESLFGYKPQAANTVTLTNAGNATITLDSIAVYKGSITAANKQNLATATLPVTFDLSAVEAAINTTMALNDTLTYTITPKNDQLNNTDATYIVETIGHTPAGTTVKSQYTYNFKVSPVTVASAIINQKTAGENPESGKTLSADYTLASVGHADGANAAAQLASIQGKINTVGASAANRDLGYAWFRSTKSNLTKADYTGGKLDGQTAIGTNKEYTLTDADGGKYIYLVVYGNSKGETDAANANGTEITKLRAFYTGEIAVYLDEPYSASPNTSKRISSVGTYQIELREGGNTITTTFDTASKSFKSTTKLDPDKEYEVWAGRSTAAGSKLMNTNRTLTFNGQSANVFYYTVKFNTDATLTNNAAGLVTDATLRFTGNKIPAALTAKIADADGDEAVANNDTVLHGTTVTFVYNTNVAGTDGGKWNDDAHRAYYNLGVTESVEMSPSIATDTPTLIGTKQYSNVAGTVTATLTQLTYDVEFGVQGTGSISKAELWVKDSTETSQKITKTGTVTEPNGVVSFGNLPAGTYTVAATPAAGSTITSYTSNGTTANVPTVTSKDVSITRETAANEFYVTLVSSTYTLRWYKDKRTTLSNTTDTTRDNLKNSGNYVYGYDTVDTTTRYLYNDGNTEVKNLKVVTAASDAGNVTVKYYKADGTTEIDMATGVDVLNPGEYIIAEITPVTRKNAAPSTPYKAQLNVTANKGGTATGSIDTADRPSYFAQYTVEKAIITVYTAGDIVAPVFDANPNPKDAAALSTREAHTVAGSSEVYTDLIDKTTLTWSPSATKFGPGAVYTVTVVATANSNYKFASVANGDFTLVDDAAATIGATPTVGGTDSNTLTLTKTFPATATGELKVTAEATGGYTGTVTEISTAATADAPQKMYYIITKTALATTPTANEIMTATVSGDIVAVGSGNATYNSGRWELKNRPVTNLPNAGHTYYVYAVAENTNTNATGSVGQTTFKTHYRVEVQLGENASGILTAIQAANAVTITAPTKLGAAVTPAGDQSKYVTYVSATNTPNTTIAVSSDGKYAFAGWEIDTGAGAIGNDKALSTTFKPTENTVLKAVFGGIPKLEATGEENSATVPSTYSWKDVHVFKNAKVTNTGTGTTKGPIGYVIINNGDSTAVKPGGSAAPTSSTDPYFQITTGGTDPQALANFSTLTNGNAALEAGKYISGFHTQPAEDGLPQGTLKSTIYFYDTLDYTLFATAEVSLTIAKAGDPAFLPQDKVWDLNKHPATPNTDWDISVDSGDYNGKALSIKLNSATGEKPDGWPEDNILVAPTHYVYTVTSGDAMPVKGTLSMQEFIDLVKDKAKEGDKYTFTATVGDAGKTADVPMTLTFIDTTPVVEKIAIVNPTLASGDTANTQLTVSAGTPTGNQVTYQWYRSDDNKADGHFEDGTTKSKWEWVPDPDKDTAITGATGATYVVQPEDAGKYIYLIAVGDGEYYKKAAVSEPKAVGSRLTVQVDAGDAGYGTVKLDNNSTPLTKVVAHGATSIIAATANAGHIFTGWTFDHADHITAPTTTPTTAATVSGLKISGNLIATAHFDKLPTITPPSATFDLATDATKAYNYTANDGSGNILVTIEGTFRADSDAATGAVSGEYTLYTTTTGTDATRTETFAKAWVEANLIVGNSYTIHVYDMEKGAKAATNGNAVYDVSATLKVEISVYTVNAITDATNQNGWGTVKVESSAYGATAKGNGRPAKIYAQPATGYVFDKWEIVGKGAPGNIDETWTGEIGSFANANLKDTTFSNDANVHEATVRALFKPGDFEPSTTAGMVRYADNKFTTTPTVKPNGITGQTFTYALANGTDNVPTWLTINANTGAISITGTAVRVNVESLDGSGTDVHDEVQVKVNVTCVQTGVTKTVDLVVDVQPSPLSIKQGDGGAKYNDTAKSGKAIDRSKIIGVESVNNIAGTSLWTPASTGGWNSENDVKWSNVAQFALGTNSYTFTASWNPPEARAAEKYNYTPATLTLPINVIAANQELRFNDVAKGGAAPSADGYEINKEHNDKSSYNNTVYLDAVKEYDVYLKNTMTTDLFNVKVTMDPANADDGGKQPFLIAESLSVGTLNGNGTTKFSLTPNPDYAFTAGEHKIKLTATGYSSSDTAQQNDDTSATATYELTYYVDRRPIPQVNIRSLTFPMSDNFGVKSTSANPDFSGSGYTVIGGKDTLTMTDTITDFRVKDAAGTADGKVKDKYGNVPYSVKYEWRKDATNTATNAGEANVFVAVLEADPNYEFTGAITANKTSTVYVLRTNGDKAYEDPDAVKTVEISTREKANDTLTFVVDKIKLKNIDVRVFAPNANGSPVEPMYTNATTHLGYEFDLDGIGAGDTASFYKWYLVDGSDMTELTEDNVFEAGNTYQLKISIDRHLRDGYWVDNDEIVTTVTGRGSGTLEVNHDGTDTTITLQWTLQKVTPPPVAPSTTYYEVNYIIVPGGNTPDPTTELVAAGGYPEHVPHVTPNNNDEYQFIGWVRDDPTGKTIKEIVPNLLVKPEMVKINQDTDFYAVYGLREIKVTYDLGSFGKTTDPTQEIVAKYAYPSFAPDVTIVDQYKNLARFVGWSIEKPDHALVVNLVDPLTTQIINDTVFYAVYEIDKYNYHEHYMIGYPNGEFRPEGKITRAEVATIIARAVMPDFIEFNDYGDGGYSDVTGHWAQSAIAFCSNTGVFVGYEDGTFRPNKPITREEYALVIARIQGLTDCEDRFVMPFKDVETVSGWALDGVYTCYDEGWIDGYEDADELGTYTFAPQRDIGRAEAAKIMNGYLNRGVNEAGVSSLNEYIQFPDVPKWYWGYWEVAEAVNDHYYYYYLEDEAGKDVPPEEWIVEAGYLNVKLDENDPDNTKNVRRSDPVYVNAN